MALKTRNFFHLISITNPRTYVTSSALSVARFSSSESLIVDFFFGMIGLKKINLRISARQRKDGKSI